MATKVLEPNSTTFTFKPKVSAHSTRIAESLGSDFASRQKQHLEKRNQYLEQASLLHNHGSPTSPSDKPKKVVKDKANKKVKENEKEGAELEPGNAPQVEQIDSEDSDSDDDLQDSMRSHKRRMRGTEMPGSTSNPNLSTAKVPPIQSKSNLELPTMDSAAKSPMALRRSTTKISLKKHRRSFTVPSSTSIDPNHGPDDSGALSDPDHISTSRSKTMPPAGLTTQRKVSNINLDRLKNAKLAAEKAMKNRKVFLIQGPYPSIRQSLRERGWVEKFYRMGGQANKSPRNKRKKRNAVAATNSSTTNAAITADQNDFDEVSDDDDDDDDDDDPNADDPNDHGGKIPPWEEDNGIYGIMSRIVRNAAPTFIWSVRRDVVDPKALKRDQIINHYGKAGSFTTKVGLCINMRNLTWYQEANPDTYFPRCYRLSHEEEKQAFIDDYRLTSCTNLLKHIKEQSEKNAASKQDDESGDAAETEKADDNMICTNPQCTKSKPNDVQGNKCIHASETTPTTAVTTTANSPRKGLPLNIRTSVNVKVDNNLSGVNNNSVIPCPMCGSPVKKKKTPYVPLRAVEVALLQCERFIRSLVHDDLDDEVDKYYMSEPEWDEFLQWYYKVINEGAVIAHTDAKLEAITATLAEMRDKWPQYELDGTKNIWMVKAGAKSRGRGIVPYARLEDMLKLVSAQVVQKEGKYVVQKYIERPLLIYNTKFDIRQWFLVTDWNPLTIWFYKDSYLRFCSQEYTLDNLDEAIHLSNNAIQKNYENGPRSKSLPAENMWTSQQFKKYARDRGFNNAWDEIVYPGMKKAVIGALLCSQDIVEYRKNAFELYGADFMLTEDYSPWLIEVNSSPSMASSTKVTSKLCNSVLADTVKVVIDRRYDKNADIGEFELAYKQSPVTVPPYIGISLSVDGAGIKKPPWMNQRKTEDAAPKISAASPRVSTTVKATPKPEGTSVSPKLYKQSYSHADKAATTQKATTKSTPTFTAKSPSVQNNSPPKASKSVNYRHRKSPMKPEVKANGNSDSKDTKSLRPTVASVEKTKGHRLARSASAREKKTPSLEGKSKGDADAQMETKSETVLGMEEVQGLDTDSESAALEQNILRQGTSVAVSDVDDANNDPSVEMALRKALGMPLYDEDMQNPSAHSMRGRSFVSPCSKRYSLDPRSSATDSERHTDRNGAASSDKLVLPMKSAETVDIQALHYDVSNKGYTMTSPLMDSQWGRTCNRCGNGMNLKLDHSRSSPCQCQQDCIRVGSDPQPTWYPQHSSSGVNGSGTRATFVPHPPNGPPNPSASLPKRIHIDKNKLVSSVYAKAQTSQMRLAAAAAANGNQTNKSGKFVLKYTDANIQKPEMSCKASGSGSFPKLVSKYVSRKGLGKDSLPICVETYKQNKVTIVTQSFQ